MSLPAWPIQELMEEKGLDGCTTLLNQLRELQSTTAYEFILSGVIIWSEESYEQVRQSLITDEDTAKANRANGQLDVLQAMKRPGLGIIEILEEYIKQKRESLEEENRNREANRPTLDPAEIG